VGPSVIAKSTPLDAKYSRARASSGGASSPVAIAHPSHRDASKWGQSSSVAAAAKVLTEGRRDDGARAPSRRRRGDTPTAAGADATADMMDRPRSRALHAFRNDKQKSAVVSFDRHEAPPQKKFIGQLKRDVIKC
tara:strand:- start:837 stop:1241 length:405 start_codon:yes stop_codon:yes gene_type:complete